MACSREVETPNLYAHELLPKYTSGHKRQQIVELQFKTIIFTSNDKSLTVSGLHCSTILSNYGYLEILLIAAENQ